MKRRYFKGHCASGSLGIGVAFRESAKRKKNKKERPRAKNAKINRPRKIDSFDAERLRPRRAMGLIVGDAERRILQKSESRKKASGAAGLALPRGGLQADVPGAERPKFARLGTGARRGVAPRRSASRALEALASTSRIGVARRREPAPPLLRLRTLAYFPKSSLVDPLLRRASPTPRPPYPPSARVQRVRTPAAFCRPFVASGNSGQNEIAIGRGGSLERSSAVHARAANATPAAHAHAPTHVDVGAQVGSRGRESRDPGCRRRWRRAPRGRCGDSSESAKRITRRGKK